MKLGRILLATATVLTTLVSTSANSQAQTIVDEALDILQPPYPSGEPLFTMCADQGLCMPGSTTLFTTDQGFAPHINNNDNDTNFSFDQIVYSILSPNAQWGNVTSNQFNVSISPDRKTATFSGAFLDPNEGFRINRNVNDGSQVNFSVSLVSGTAVPEPSATLGLLAVSALGGVLLWKRKNEQKQLAGGTLSLEKK